MKKALTSVVAHLLVAVCFLSLRVLAQAEEQQTFGLVDFQSAGTRRVVVMTIGNDRALHLTPQDGKPAFEVKLSDIAQVDVDMVRKPNSFEAKTLVIRYFKHGTVETLEFLDLPSVWLGLRPSQGRDAESVLSAIRDAIRAAIARTAGARPNDQEFEVECQCDRYLGRSVLYGSEPYRPATISRSGTRMIFGAPTQCLSKGFAVDLDQVISADKTAKDSRDFVEIVLTLNNKRQTLRVAAPIKTPEGSKQYVDRLWVFLDNSVNERKEFLAKERAEPAGLEIKPEFDDSQSISTDGLLEAGKKAGVMVKVENHGPGRAYAVRLVPSSENNEVKLGSSVDLGDMEPNTIKSVEVPVQASLSVGNGEAGLDLKRKRSVVSTLARFACCCPL